MNAALQEDVHVIGLSILSGAHNAIVPRVMDLLKQNKMDDVLVVVGGIIPNQDVDSLKKAGVAAIFQPGTAMDDIVQFIRANVKPRGVPTAMRLMAEISTSRLKELLQRTVGPTPWYWKTFPAFNSASGQRFVWTHHGERGTARLSGFARPGAGTRQAAPGAEYVLPSVFRAAVASGDLVPRRPQHSLRLLRSRSAQGFRLRGNCRLVQAVERAHLRGDGARRRFRSLARPGRRHAQDRSAIGVATGGRTDHSHQLSRPRVPTIRPSRSMSSICKRDWSRCCRRNGSRPASIRWESNGSRGRRAIRSRIGFLASVSEQAVSCWRKMDAGWSGGWRRALSEVCVTL